MSNSKYMDGYKPLPEHLRAEAETFDNKGAGEISIEPASQITNSDNIPPTSGDKKPRYIVGAKKNPDGTWDYSQAATWDGSTKDKTKDITDKDTKPILTAEKLQSLAQGLMHETDFGKNLQLRHLAKKFQTEPYIILQEVRNFKKTQIKNREKGDIRHFHRTSFKNFEVIAEMGKLISRSKIKKAKPDHSISSWSASDDVMMTRDHFDSEGNLIVPGFHDKEVVGASGSGVMLVFSDKIMENDDYDALGIFPTISDLPLDKYCEAILVDNVEDKETAQKILSSNNLDIPIHLKSDWQRK